MEDKIDLLFDKKEFIENELFALVSKLDPDIEVLEYIYMSYSKEEYCKIYYTKGSNIKVCITADSLKAITIDVLKAI